MNKLRYYKLMEGVDKHLEISQYMDLDYFLCLLESRKYYVKQKKKFPDKHESTMPLKAMFKMQPVNTGSYKGESTDVNDLFERIQRFKESGTMLTACWTEHNGENALMWKSFTSKMGVCIKSSICNFIASFETDDYDICCGRMSYTGIKSDHDFEDSLFAKDNAFEAEREIRFYFTPKNNTDTSIQEGVSLPVSPEVMVNEVILSPYINIKARNVLMHFISEKYNINVTTSKIEFKL